MKKNHRPYRGDTIKRLECFLCNITIKRERENINGPLHKYKKNVTNNPFVKTLPMMTMISDHREITLKNY